MLSVSTIISADTIQTKYERGVSVYSIAVSYGPHDVLGDAHTREIRGE